MTVPASLFGHLQSVRDISGIIRRHSSALAYAEQQIEKEYLFWLQHK